MKKKTFRPTFKNWLSRVAGPILLFWAFATWLWLVNSARPIVPGIMVLISIPILVFDRLTLARSWLEVDAQGLRGRLEGVSLDIPWHVVRALGLAAHEEKRRDLVLGLADGSISLPLTYLDTKAVMRAVMEVAPSEAFENDAFEHLTWVRHLQHHHARLLAGAHGPVRIRMRRYTPVIGAFGLVFFLLLFVWFNEESLALRLGFLGFALSQVYPALHWTRDHRAIAG